MNHQALADTFHALLDTTEQLRQIGTGFNFTEGPIWHPVEEYLLFSDMPDDKRRRWDAAGITEAMHPSNKGNGMTYDQDLNLIVCEHATSTVARFDSGGDRSIIASHFEGKQLNSPNDVCVKADGTIWFTDPTYGRMPGFGVERELELSFRGVYRIDPGADSGEPTLVVDRNTYGQPNGLCFSPDEKLLYVNDTEHANIRVYQVSSDNSLSNEQVFANAIADPSIPGRPDGMKCDANGNVWVTAPGGLWTYDPSGVLIGKVAVPENAANLHWGGQNWKTLFICATSSVYAVTTKVGPHRESFMPGDTWA